MGMEIDTAVKRKEIERIVKEMMEWEERKKMRKKASEWREKAEKTTNGGGSSYNNFDRVIKEVLLAKKGD
ncbi:hypothetical protein GIB67_031367 [Kingdonia uniflora]|uniref:Uncharacterized protein n=1 Tax=Kingdonia uniflora TaxID=39325 RepID=A0A7J7MAW8_9MAGN|nr:hypothetical protein GIB67_031367 [Kingdonia uniflora]